MKREKKRNITNEQKKRQKGKQQQNTDEINKMRGNIILKMKGKLNGKLQLEHSKSIDL